MLYGDVRRGMGMRVVEEMFSSNVEASVRGGVRWDELKRLGA